MFHHFQNFTPVDQHFDDFCLISGISDYEFGDEGGFFKPQPTTEQPLITLDDLSMILCDDDVILQENKFTNIESNDLYHEYEDILLEETSSPSKFGLVESENDNLHHLGKITKSMSFDSLSSVNRAQISPNSVNFTETELKNVYGMRRAFSEEYIKPQLMSDHAMETRMQKLSRYRDKKTKRNFSRKIKYACRKALADGQPRIRGRFAKTEDT